MELKIIGTPINFAVVIIKDKRDSTRISNIHLYQAKQKVIDFYTLYVDMETQSASPLANIYITAMFRQGRVEDITED